MHRQLDRRLVWCRSVRASVSLIGTVCFGSLIRHSAFAPAHAALLELLPAPAGAWVVPAHLLLGAKEWRRFPFQKIFPLLRRRRLRRQSGLRRGLEETTHLLHFPFLLGPFLLG